MHNNGNNKDVSPITYVQIYPTSTCMHIKKDARYDIAKGFEFNTWCADGFSHTKAYRWSNLLMGKQVCTYCQHLYDLSRAKYIEIGL